MAEVRAIYHRAKQTNIYPLAEDRFLIEALLRDEVHDVIVEVEVVHPSLEIVAARSEIRNGPFTNVCNMTHVNMQGLVGMKVGRGFTVAARAAVGGGAGCHRISELVVEIAQAAYQLHFVRFFNDVPKEVREKADVPIDRWRAVNQAIPGMRNTCFSYSDVRETLIEEKAQPLQLLDQDMPVRNLGD
ncbi:MAG: DUF2889 domain-containing protein [Candidatus Binatia bacterium]